jgi:hypothetical protein
LGNGRVLAQGTNKILGRKGFTAAGHVLISTRKSITRSINSKVSASDMNKMVPSVRAEITVSEHEISLTNLGLWVGSHMECNYFFLEEN